MNEHLLLNLDEVMLTGSTTENKYHKNSDVDILALSKKLNRTVIETFIEGNICYQFIILPYYKASVLLFSDYLKGNSVYRSMIEKGIILRELSNLQLSQLQDFYKRIPHKNPDERAVLSFRHGITELLNDINDSNTPEENVFIAMDLLKQTALLATCEPDQQGKHLARKLMIHPRNKDLFDGFVHFIQTNDISTFIAAVENILCSCGGRLQKYSSGYVFAIPDEHYLMIQFPEHTIFQDTIRQTVSEITALLPPEVLWHSFYTGNNQFMERGVYFYILTGNPDKTAMLKETIDCYFKTVIDKFIRRDIRMSYPYQTSFHEGLLWGGKLIHNQLIPFFSELSRLIWKNIRIKPDKTELFNLAFELIIYLCHQLFKNVKERIAFLNFYIECNLCEVTDINGIYPVSLLESVKHSVLKYNKELFAKQKKSLAPVTKLMKSVNIEEDNEYFQFSSKLSQILLVIKPDDMEFSCFYDSDNPIFTLYCSVINHLFASMYLNIQEGFSIIYYYRNLNKGL